MVKSKFLAYFLYRIANENQAIAAYQPMVYEGGNINKIHFAVLEDHF